jgi:hypothetical protein
MVIDYGTYVVGEKGTARRYINSVRIWTPTPKDTPNAMTDFGSNLMLLALSESKYRTSPALDINPPPLELPLIPSPPVAPTLNLSTQLRRRPTRKKRLCAAVVKRDYA